MKRKAEKIVEDVMENPDVFADVLKKEDLLKKERWFLDSGNIALNYIMSGSLEGGYPSGIVEIHGDPSTGKSMLFAKAIAEAQKREIPILLADAEGRWDDEFASIHGVDSEKLQKFYPDTVERFAIRTYDILTKDPKPYLIVLDSLAILSTIAEKSDMEDGELKVDMGKKAQKIKMAIRNLTSEINKTGSIWLVSNHLIAQQGLFVSKTTPGGQGVPYQANIRLLLTKPTPIKYEGKERPIGVRLHIECDKNSITAPFGSCKMDLYFGRGVDRYSGLLDIAVDLGLVKKAAGPTPYLYEETKFKKEDFQRICIDSDILSKQEWIKPYWLL